MVSYQCCDCGEIKATKCLLEAHLNSDHIGWSPYQCFYCYGQGISTRKPNKEMLREHVTLRHPIRPFTFLCTDDQRKEERLKDMLHRSMPQNNPPNVTTGDDRLPFVITLSSSPPPIEVIDLEESESNSVVGDDPVTQNAHVKGNISIVGDFRCATCQKCVPRNLAIIRDHVKVHFKEKTGCMPVDLTKLLPNLQQVYCQLLMTSFPSVGDSILEDDIPNCHKATNPKQPDNGPTQIDTLHDPHSSHYQISSGNVSLLAENKSISSANVTCTGYDCEGCGKKFDRLISLKTHRKLCKLTIVNEDPKSATPHLRKNRSSIGQGSSRKKLTVNIDSSSSSRKNVAAIQKAEKSKKLRLPYFLRQKRNRLLDNGISAKESPKFAHAKAKKTNRALSCEICNKTFPSIGEVKRHRYYQHGILVNWYCKECDINLKSGMVVIHILDVHLGKKGFYSCSLCDMSVKPATLNHHDQRHHDGLGKAHIVNNMHHYKVQVEALRKKLIVDLNSSLSSGKKLATKSKSQQMAMSKKLVEVKARKTNHALSCQICNATFSSTRSMSLHRVRKHGVPVEWYCKQCKINLKGKFVSRHLLRAHMGKKEYMCSLCDSSVNRNKIVIHDQSRHNGLGKAQAINNYHHYQKEIEELRDALIIDVDANAMFKVGNSGEKKKISQSKSIAALRAKSGNSIKKKSIPQSTGCHPIAEVHLKSARHLSTDNLKWLKRFKRGQKRKQKQPKISTFK